VETVLLDWARQRFPDAAAPYVAARSGAPSSSIITADGTWRIGSPSPSATSGGIIRIILGTYCNVRASSGLAIRQIRRWRPASITPIGRHSTRSWRRKTKVLVQVNLAQADLEKGVRLPHGGTACPAGRGLSVFGRRRPPPTRVGARLFSQRMFMGEPSSRISHDWQRTPCAAWNNMKRLRASRMVSIKPQSAATKSTSLCSRCAGELANPPPRASRGSEHFGAGQEGGRCGRKLTVQCPSRHAIPN